MLTNGESRGWTYTPYLLTVSGLSSWPLNEWYFPINNVCWTISTMLFFYMVFPFVIPFMQVCVRHVMLT